MLHPRAALLDDLDGRIARVEAEEVRWAAVVGALAPAGGPPRAALRAARALLEVTRAELGRLRRSRDELLWDGGDARRWFVGGGRGAQGSAACAPPGAAGGS